MFIPKIKYKEYRGFESFTLASGIVIFLFSVHSFIESMKSTPGNIDKRLSNIERALGIS